MNRNKLIQLFVSNLANVIVHEILEKAIDKPEISQVYNKEIKNSLEIAKAYRKKINPSDKTLPDYDIKEIKQKITNKVKTDLILRIQKGYKNLDLSLIEILVVNKLKELRV